ncbi:hypothetical protein BH11MYX3_BH11MYX3_11840 [soil metagenome]
MRAVRWLFPLLLLAGVAHADGHVVVPSAPADVYATVTRYELWPYIFPEVKAVRVVYQRGPKAIIEVTSWNGTRQTLELLGDDQKRTIRCKERGDRTGAEAAFVFASGGTATTTLASTRFTAGEVSVPGVRHQRASTDLASIRAYFAAR